MSAVLHKRPKLVPANMTDLELASYANSLPLAAERHRAAELQGMAESGKKLQSTLHLLAQVRNEIDRRAGLKGRVALVSERKLSPFEAFAAVARAVLPDDLYWQIASEANALLGDEATPEYCAVLSKVRARSAA